ncbi:hypothetical protein PROFUN_10847 [Planoprotostelium fungivorum]|uniref:Uncharacterized protein n=1 Tax=Planoprotostelium fungivorum TaxID=1890364 RepID=A0A2P6NCR5_9EUKA|nr:hypothetical protein PROFUN_10847 [Planoprotostelium fungivorum]
MVQKLLLRSQSYCLTSLYRVSDGSRRKLHLVGPGAVPVRLDKKCCPTALTVTESPGLRKVSPVIPSDRKPRFYLPR